MERLAQMGQVARTLGLGTRLALRAAWEQATPAALAAWQRRMDALGRWALLVPLPPASDLPAPITGPAALPLAEGAAVPEVESAAVLTATTPALMGGAKSMSLPAASRQTAEGLQLLAVGLAHYAADGVEEELADGLAALSLPTAQDVTVGQLGMRDVLAAAATLSRGAANPAVNRIVAAAALRRHPFLLRTIAMGMSVTWCRFLPRNTLYVVPDPTCGAVVAPVHGFRLDFNERFSAAAQVRFMGTASMAPASFRSGYIVRGVIP